ncbi:formate/nitrite transporter, partial [Staphylococcus pseudintermedius]
YLLRAMMAGFIISIITVFVLTVKTTFAPDVAPGLVNMAGGVFFFFFLLFIFFSKPQIFISNFFFFF